MHKASGVSEDFLQHFKGALRNLQERFKRALRELQESFKIVSREPWESFEIDLKELQEIFKRDSKEFQESFQRGATKCQESFYKASKELLRSLSVNSVQENKRGMSLRMSCFWRQSTCGACSLFFSSQEIGFDFWPFPDLLWWLDLEVEVWIGEFNLIASGSAFLDFWPGFWLEPWF